MNSELVFLVSTVRKELWKRWRLALVLFVLTASVFLSAAWTWPKIFTSSSVILIDQQSILSPLMQGTAVATEVKNRAKIAQKVIFNRKSLEKVVALTVWAGEDAEQLTPKEFDLLKKEIKDSAEVVDLGQNLIEISFKDKNAEKAYRTAKLLTKIFIDESINAKKEESRSAYEFIAEQVTIYQTKLRQAEDAIKDFRSKNVDATQGIKENVDARIVEIKREIEDIELEISTERSNIESNEKRLTGEISAETNASFEKENELQLRIEELEKRLGDLRLNYKETYPDIIQIKGQIGSLRGSLKAESDAREAASKAGTRIIPSGSIAQDLKRKILISEAAITTFESKLAQLDLLMSKERKTLSQINSVETEVAELNRDYDVNQTMYKDLLSQRENARVSMNMDIKNQGLSIKIQDPAILPVTPKGLRFSHIILAGLLLSLFIPMGLVYGITLIDKKVRNESYLRDELRLPVLAAVYNLSTSVEARQTKMKLVSIAVVLLSTWSIYGYAIILRLQE